MTPKKPVYLIILSRSGSTPSGNSSWNLFLESLHLHLSVFISWRWFLSLNTQLSLSLKLEVSCCTWVVFIFDWYVLACFVTYIIHKFFIGRELIQEELLDIEINSDTRIGGPDKVVEVDESVFGEYLSVFVLYLYFIFTLQEAGRTAGESMMATGFLLTPLHFKHYCFQAGMGIWRYLSRNRGLLHGHLPHWRGWLWTQGHTNTREDDHSACSAWHHDN